MTFDIPVGTHRLIDSAAWLAAKLLERPDCSAEEIAALGKVLFALQRLPRTTPALCVDYGFNFRDACGNLYYGSIHFDDTELMWSVGGSVNGPSGSDSYTSFQLSLLRGCEDSPIGTQEAWFELTSNLPRAPHIEVEDNCDESFWDLHRR